MNKIKAIKYKKNLCFKCLDSVDEGEIKFIEFGALGYGSYFDNCSTILQLCEDCSQKAPVSVSNLKYDPENLESECGESYLNENEIFGYFDSLPPEGQQFVKNEFWAYNHYPMEPQDWIDYNINKCLPYEVAKEYDLYALEEIEAYKTRFPKCEHPAVREYSDGSSGCYCPFDASGNRDQSISKNISKECYQCQYFKERTSERKIISDENWERYIGKATLAAMKNKPMALEFILFKSYGCGCLPDIVKPEVNRNPAEMLFRDRVGAVVEELKKVAIILETTKDYTQEISDRIKQTGEVVYFKAQDRYYYFVKDPIVKYMAQHIYIEKIDTTKYWTLNEYDGVESIRYIDFEIVDANIGYCRWNDM